MITPAWLFCPAHRAERLAKAAAAADTVIVDLEDGVPDAAKDVARAALIASDLDPAQVVVRIAAAGEPHHAADLAAVRATAYRTVMLAKAEHPDQLDALAGLQVVALCESARGVLAAAAIAAHPRAVALMWGSEDLLASLGGRDARRPDGDYRDVARVARAAVLFAAAAAGKAAIDAVHVAIDDLDRLAIDAEEAAASGFAAKACIHPTHVPVIRSAFAPTADQIEWARQVVRAGAGGGAAVLHGRMIDEPTLRQARATLAQVDRAG